MDSSAPSYVGFGMLTPVAIMIVNQLPEHNTGAIVKDVNEFLFDDAAQRGAGFIYGYLHNWNLEKSLRFATAATSLKVTKAGLQMFPIEEIKSLASKLEVKYPAINGKL